MSDPNEFPASNQRRSGGVPVRPKTVAVAVIAVLAIWFIAINTGSVKIHLYFSTVMAPLWIVLTATAIGGALIGWFGSHRAAKNRNRRRAEQPRRRR
ncbi:LapA family protein [Streptomyces sp.]|uniref:LapA family protein n=1 Tax=Streptomyces sp. TaxID=1931 RepID=UPI002F3FB0DB